MAIESHEKAARYAGGVKELLSKPEVREAITTLPEERDKAQEKIISRLKYYVMPVTLASTDLELVENKYRKAYPISDTLKRIARGYGGSATGIGLLNPIAFPLAASGALLHLIGRTNTPNVEAVESEFRKTMKIAKSKRLSSAEREQLLDATIAHLDHQVSAHENYVEKAKGLLRQRKADRENREKNKKQAKGAGSTDELIELTRRNMKRRDDSRDHYTEQRAMIDELAGRKKN